MCRTGASQGGALVNTLKNGIKTYTEQIQDEVLLHAISNSVTEAEVIVIMGFGFHPQNMKLLNPEKPIRARRIIASAYETSDANKNSIHDMLSKLGKRKGAPVITIDPSTCGKVLADNRRDILAHDL